MWEAFHLKYGWCNLDELDKPVQNIKQKGIGVEMF